MYVYIYIYIYTHIDTRWEIDPGIANPGFRYKVFFYRRVRFWHGFSLAREHPIIGGPPMQ